MLRAKCTKNILTYRIIKKKIAFTFLDSKLRLKQCISRPFIHFHVVAVPLSNSLTRCRNMVVIGQEAKKSFLQHLAPELHCQNSYPHQHLLREPSYEKRPCCEASFCKSSNCSHYPRTVRIQWFAHLWRDWRRMLKSFACIKQVSCAALLLLFSSYSSANWDAEDWVNWTSGQILRDT